MGCLENVARFKLNAIVNGKLFMVNKQKLVHCVHIKSIHLCDIICI